MVDDADLVSEVEQCARLRRPLRRIGHEVRGDAVTHNISGHEFPQPCGDAGIDTVGPPQFGK